MSVLLLFRWSGVADLVPGCPLYDLTGVYCPGCGATRALKLLARGEFFAAIAMNPLLPILLVIVILLISLPPRILGPVYRSRPFVWIAVGFVVVFTVARNLPWEPFRLLAPGAMFAR